MIGGRIFIIFSPEGSWSCATNCFQRVHPSASRVRRTVIWRPNKSVIFGLMQLLFESHIWEVLRCGIFLIWCSVAKDIGACG